MSAHPVERRDISIDLLEANELNPNKMTKRAFNNLVDNVAKMGITDAILVVDRGNGKYRIVGGHHRVEAAKVLGYVEIPCSIITDPNFDEDQEQFQLMRHNMIKGQLDPQAFVKLYESVQGKYSDDILADAFGFEEQAQLTALIKKTQKNLPPEMRSQFKEAAKEVKTIKDLSQLLNRLFNSYGDTLPYGFMFLDFGGKESIWLRMMQKDLNNLQDVYTAMRESGKTLDGVIRGFLQSIAKGENVDINTIIQAAPTVDFETPPDIAPIEEQLGMLNTKAS